MDSIPASRIRGRGRYLTILEGSKVWVTPEVYYRLQDITRNPLLGGYDEVLAIADVLSLNDAELQRAIVTGLEIIIDYQLSEENERSS